MREVLSNQGTVHINEINGLVTLSAKTFLIVKTASVGWTTDPKGGNYTDSHIDAMIEAITTSGMADSKTR